MMVTTQIPDREVEQIDVIARSRGQSRSAFVKEAVARHMAELTPPQRRVRSRKSAQPEAS